MLRVVREGEKAPQNEALRRALSRVTRGSPTLVGLHFFEAHEADALYRVLASRPFTQAQLDAWVDRLRADHPHDRRPTTVSKFGFWSWVRYVIFGGDKPQEATVESLTDWVKRVERWVQGQVSSVDEPTWLERPLQALNTTRYQIEHETGEAQWAMPVLRWALLHLLTLPPDASASGTSATG